jgi:hypothetical protein
MFWIFKYKEFPEPDEFLNSTTLSGQSVNRRKAVLKTGVYIHPGLQKSLLFKCRLRPNSYREG